MSHEDDLSAPQAHMVLYCLVRRRPEGKSTRFLMILKEGHPTFPPTKFRPGEDLYSAMARPMEEDLGLPKSSYFPEEELPMIPNAGESPRYSGLAKRWYLYPVTVSLTNEGIEHVDKVVQRPSSRLEQTTARLIWWTLDEILLQAQEPNVRAIANYLRDHRPDLVTEPVPVPSIDAMACQWAASQEGGVRVVRGSDIRRMLDSGSRAFNLRVADPYLPYQKQGLGFTWSFFTPKDKQDLHVHGLPAVEIYGVLEGRLQLWHKPMNHRGVRMWQCQVLEAGDWAEVEPLHCHFACWLTPKGFGTVIKAAGSGELAGVGRIGVSGKTTCVWKGPDGREQHCSNHRHCAIPPAMQCIMDEYAKLFEERDFKLIERTARQGEALQGQA